MVVKIDAANLSFKELNKLVREAVAAGEDSIELLNVNGQRYIGGGISREVRITIYGTAGNDLGVFMNGPTIVVHGNAGDGVANTMNRGSVIIHGNAGDVVGYSMRGGEVFVRGDVGYRVGIHMKEYGDSVPVIVVGGIARDFLGEYMAGGRLVVLGLGREGEIVGSYMATGMHGGKIFVRGGVDAGRLGVGARLDSVNEEDRIELERILTWYCRVFNIPLDLILESEFSKIVPVSYRPYEGIYALHSG